MKNILFFNKKGGQGKTTLATNYCKYVNGNFITNDVNNFTLEVYAMEATVLAPDDDITELEVSEAKANIFDFGGFSDDRVFTLAEFCDTCVIPVFYQSEIDLRVAVETEEAMSEHSDHVIFVINNTENDNIEDLRTFLSQRKKTFVIPRSRFFSETKLGILEYREQANPLQRHILDKKVIPQVKELFNYISKECK